MTRESDCKIYRILELRWYLSSKSSESKIDAVGNERKYCSVEAKSHENKLENPLIIAGHAFELRDGDVAGVLILYPIHSHTFKL